MRVAGLKYTMLKAGHLLPVRGWGGGGVAAILRKL